MAISQTPDLFEEVLHGGPIPYGKLSYFRTRFRSQLHNLILSRFHQQETLKKADLARRIHRSPAVINRLLASPGNWTLDTVSDLLIGLAAIPNIDTSDVRAMLRVNSRTDAQIAALVKGEKQRSVEIPQPKAMAQGAQR